MGNLPIVIARVYNRGGGCAVDISISSILEREKLTVTPVGSSVCHVDTKEGDSLSNIVFVVNICKFRAVLRVASIIEHVGSPAGEPPTLELGQVLGLSPACLLEPLVVLSIHHKTGVIVGARQSSRIMIERIHVNRATNVFKVRRPALFIHALLVVGKGDDYTGIAERIVELLHVKDKRVVWLVDSLA